MSAEELQAAVDAAQLAAEQQGDAVRALKADLKQGKVEKVSTIPSDAPRTQGTWRSCRRSASPRVLGAQTAASGAPRSAVSPRPRIVTRFSFAHAVPL